MKQLKSYFQRVDDLKNQLKNMTVADSSPDIARDAGNKERASSRDRQKPSKPVTGSRKGENSLSRLYVPPKKDRSNSRYKPRSASDSKQQQNSRSQSHFTSTDYDKLKMSYLKNVGKQPRETTARPAREEIKKLIQSIKCRDQRSTSRPREKDYKSTTVAVQKNPRNSQNMFQSIQVEVESSPVKMSWSYRTKQGVLVTNPKKVNQDSLLIKTKMLGSNVHLFAVADGHGLFGHQVSQLAAKNLSKYMESFMKNLSPEESFQLAYLKLQQLINESQINAMCSGTTLVSVLIRSNELICANAGDSRAIMARRNEQKWDIVELSRDHKPSLPDEKERILKMGGRIDTFKDERGNPLGPERVWLPNQKIQGLAMSRSLGDNISKDVGVVCEPELRKMRLDDRDKFVVLASDGIWQFITNEEVVQLVAPFYRDGRLEEACDALMRLAYERWTVEDQSVIDDITLVLIFLNC